MIQLIDFSNCELSSRNLEYGGRAGEKRGIKYKGENWFLKFPKNTEGMAKVGSLSYVTSPLSEYIGSNIYKILGYEAHETILGVCNDGKRLKVVCACKDFIEDDKNELLIPYTALRNDTNPNVMMRHFDGTASASNINEIQFQLENNTVLSTIPNAIERFWDVVLIDMVINNNDRNEDNWGVIKYKQQEKYKLAPIYDCGNCFYGKSSDERIQSIMNDEKRLQSSALNGITAYEDNEEKRITFLDMLKNDELCYIEARNRIIEKLKYNMDKIIQFIDEIPVEFMGVLIMSNIRKDYYKSTMRIRLEALENSLNK